MNSVVQIRRMQQTDVDMIYQTLEVHEIRKPLEYIKRCWEENITGDRVTLLALYDNRFAGWLHLLSKSNYPYFVEHGIPEINNVDVIPPLRRLGIGNALMEAIEQVAFEKYGNVGIGVGLYYDYGQAQRLYAKRGYIPDGRGLFYQGKQAGPGDLIPVGHEVALHLIKGRPSNSRRELRQ